MKKTIALICLFGLSILLTNTSAVAKPRNVKGSAKTNNAPKKANTKKQPSKNTKSNPKSTSKSNSKADPKADAKKLKLDLKEWGKKKKDMKPLQLRDLIEENHRLRLQKQKLDVNIKEIETKLRETITKELMHEKANAAIRDLSELPAGSYTIDKATGQVFIGGILDERYGVDPTTGLPFIKGVIFKVQIGANKDLDLKEVLIDEVHHENLEQEHEENLFKYTIGHFRNYWEANKLKKGLRAMGIKLAWIVPYKDGKRVLLKEVLPTVIEQKKHLKTTPTTSHEVK
ncbi:MAG: hypothetical protein BGO68_05740 [Candidatus Amoebophilus sp. 36-38]|nr:MAG: hypothetical protein BGO68_05740 [Candidatus Amoebophilus sp. 36-38]